MIATKDERKMDLIPAEPDAFLGEHLEAYEELKRVIEDVIKDLRSPNSKRIYRHDGYAFGRWLLSKKLLPRELTRDHLRDYHEHLGAIYKSAATSQRMWSVTRRIMGEYVASDRMQKNPTEGLKGFSVDDETTHTVLTKSEAETMLSSIDQSTRMGKRDYALLQVLLRTGLRRFEAASMTVGDMRVTQGHYILTVVGKGDKRANVKLPVDVYRHIDVYLRACSIEVDVARPRDRLLEVDALPLFFGFKQKDEPTYQSITAQQIYRIVLKYGRAIGSDVTPHGLRATLITYLLGEGVPLHKVQYAARHKQPGTTERYQVRKENLDDSALDRFYLE